MTLGDPSKNKAGFKRLKNKILRHLRKERVELAILKCHREPLATGHEQIAVSGIELIPANAH